MIPFSAASEAVYHEAVRFPLNQILSTPPLSILPLPNTTFFHPVHYDGNACIYQPPAGPPGLTPAQMARHNRGQQLIREANEANPYRSRHDEERARSRSPYRMPQMEYRDPYGGMQMPDPASSRQVPPPSPSHPLTFTSHPSRGFLSPEDPGRGRRREKELHSNGPPKRTDAPLQACDDDNEDPVLQELCQELGSPDRAIDGAYDTHNASSNEDIPVCEFAAPCRLNGSPDGYHFRKVVSHVFGRNKAVTKIFPQDVWVHYCRKHYQRARYRADQWPFTQCDLLLESLRRMQEWNGVDTWDIALRRREKIRRKIENGQLDSPSKQGGPTKTVKDEGQAAVKNTRPGRKHPTAIIAPAPDWLNNSVGKGKSFDEIRTVIERVRNYMADLRHREREQQEKEKQDALSPPTTPENGQPDVSPRPRPKRAPKVKVTKLRPAVSMVRFPDVEILPHFKPWVKEAALRQRSATAPPLGDDDTKGQGQKQKVEIGHASAKGEGTRGEISPHHRRSTSNCLPYRTSPRASTQPGRRHTLGSTAHAATTPNRGLQGTIGRAGTNRGNSASQQRRSERVYQQALDRVSPQRSVKKNKLDQK